MPAGGLAIDDARWVSCRPGFFLPVRVLSRLFRRLFLEHMHDAFDAGQLRFTGALHALSQVHAFTAHLRPTQHTEWVVYAKRPFAGPQQVLDYVGRYTHRIAISNNRLIDMDDGHVRFQYKDYRDRSDGQRTLTLAATEFIRRFLQHVLPRGFHRIRYYGLLGNRHRKAKLALCRQLLGMCPETVSPALAPSQDYRDRYEVLTGISLGTCPVCGAGRMLLIEQISRCCLGPTIIDTS